MFYVFGGINYMMYLLKFKHSSVCTHHEWFTASGREDAKIKANMFLTDWNKPYNVQLIEVGEVIDLQVASERDWKGSEV